MAAEADVGTLVLSHFTPSWAPDGELTDEHWEAGARKGFGGRVVVGHDLMGISLRAQPSRAGGP